MRVARLLSIIIYLLNRDLVSAAELARRFGVSSRTIQRDMSTLEEANIPIFAVQGPQGGYGILDTYKLDKQLLNRDDLYYILMSLQGVGASFHDDKVTATLEKVRTLVPDAFFAERDEKLSVDFSMLDGGTAQRHVFDTLKYAVDKEYQIRFDYLNNHLEPTTRTVEPMTLAFHWRALYLYGWCGLRQDYRLFRLSRIQKLEVLPQHFQRRSQTFHAFIKQLTFDNLVDITLDVIPEARDLIEAYTQPSHIQENPDGSLRITAAMPEDAFLYSYLMSFGRAIVVVSPAHIRQKLAAEAALLVEQYRT
jgi:predicted DNA-binding transcriptional regulator YafY